MKNRATIRNTNDLMHFEMAGNEIQITHRYQTFKLSMDEMLDMLGKISAQLPTIAELESTRKAAVNND